MSRSKVQIFHSLIYEPIRDVYLNRNGKLIGQIVRWRGKLAYLSWRTKEHYYIKNRGFGIDKALLMNLIKDDRIEYIVIEYRGVPELRYFISLIDEWIDHSITVSYTKDMGKAYETYGIQRILNEDYMDELEVMA